MTAKDKALQITPYLSAYFIRQDTSSRFVNPGFMNRETTSYFFTQQRIEPEIIYLKQQIIQAQELTDPAQAARRLAELSAELQKLEALADGNI